MAENGGDRRRQQRKPLDPIQLIDDLQFLVGNDERLWLVTLAELIHMRREMVEAQMRRTDDDGPPHT